MLPAAKRKARRTRRSPSMAARLLNPCFSAFPAQRALPAAVLGPVAFSHGDQVRISAA